MANPSDYPASAAGTEVLRRAYEVSLNNAAEVVLAGEAKHIYTILSIIFHNKHVSTACNIGLQISAEATTAILLMDDQPLPGDGTFVFSDKIVIVGTDELIARNATAENVDVYISYIDQEFA